MGQYILSNASYLTYWQDSAQFITPYLLKFSCPGFQDTTYLTALHTPGGSLAFSFPHPSVHKMSKCPRGQSTYLVFIYSHFVMLFHLVTSNIICMPKTLKFRLLAHILPQTSVLHNTFVWLANEHLKCDVLTRIAWPDCWEQEAGGPHCSGNHPHT